jgi:oligosaccharyltransferase complex subunit alpha (ribophorin I)
LNREFSKKFNDRKKEVLTYDLNEPFAPLLMEKLRLHYIYNKAVGVMNYAVRTFEISHWGNIAVEEKYQVENIGSKLEGEFGRVDYDEEGRRGAKNSLGNLKANLPMKAFGLWFRDEIGNVTTSNAAREVGIYYFNI